VGENRKEITFNAVVLNTVTRLMVLDRDKGTEIRNVPLGSPANAAGASDGRNIFIGSLKGLYHCFTLDKGVLAWTRKTDAMISVPLAYYNNHIYVASEDHTFYVSKNDPNGTKVWQQKLGGSVIAAFEVEDRGCFVPCEDGRVYAFHPMTGDKVWDPFLCRARLTTPVQVGRGAVFQYAKGDKFYAINIGNGGELWSLPEGRMVLAVIEDDVYLLDKDGNLRIITERKGKLKAVVPLDRLTVFAPNTKLPAMYGASDSGWVVCISPISQGYITPEMLLKKD
jgi:outer membrane protein assembly factor BamB